MRCLILGVSGFRLDCSYKSLEEEFFDRLGFTTERDIFTSFIPFEMTTKPASATREEAPTPATRKQIDKSGLSSLVGPDTTTLRPVTVTPPVVHYGVLGKS